MALLKNFPLPQNPQWNATYIRVDAVMYQRRELVLEIVLGYYADEACAIGERPPVGTDVIRIQGEECEMIMHELHDAVGSIVYDAVKAQEKYIDAANA